MKKRGNLRHNFLIFLSIILATSCLLYGGDGTTMNYRINSDVEVWLTTSNQKNLLSQQPAISAFKKAEKTDESVTQIEVNPEITYQEMDGFGASLTDASAWLIYNVLDEKQRKELMYELFSPEIGIGISFLRQPMGASDFALKMYTYDDVPEGEEDFELKYFSIDHDKEYIIPLIKKAIEINPDLKVMASPWSPPAWMKTSRSLIGGSLREECYDVYARYFVEFIKAYEKEGIPIYAITVQNEPLYVPKEYPGMFMSPEAQAIFINEYLGPLFEKENIDTLILCYDHNWDNIEYPEIVLKKAGKYVAGTAWHVYGGDHSAMTKIKVKFSDKEAWLTEASGGEWVPPFFDAFADQMTHIIRGTRNFAKSIVWWNMALDQNNGPTVLKHSTCRGIVTIDTDKKDITYNVDYYTMGHISKFVQPGAYRIESTNIQSIIETTAFKNPNDSIVLIVYNRTNNNKKLSITYGDSEFNYTLRGKSAVTFIWNN